MLEFKNVRVALGGGRRSTPVSVVIGRGEMVCISGAQGTGKTRLLLSVLGLEPVAEGYLTVDGELVGTGSAGYFRQLMAYVPGELPDQPITVGELCQMALGARGEHDESFNRERMMEQWKVLQLDASLYNQQLSAVGAETLQVVMLSLLPLLCRPIILIDDMPQTHIVYEFLHRLAQDGAEILYTCEQRLVPCDKLISI